MTLTVINVYVPIRVAGSTSVWNQTKNTMHKLKLCAESLSPADYVYERIGIAVRKAQSAGRQVLVGGDFNEGHGKKSKMTKCMEKLQLEMSYQADMQ